MEPLFQAAQHVADAHDVAVLAEGGGSAAEHLLAILLEEFADAMPGACARRVLTVALRAQVRILGDLTVTPAG